MGEDLGEDLLEPDPLEGLTHYQRRQATRPPSTGPATRLATYHQAAWRALIAFRRVQGRVNEAQFGLWAERVAEDVDAFGEQAVAFALNFTADNMTGVRQPMAFYRAVLKRHAAEANDPTLRPLGPVMTKEELAQLIADAKEGRLS